MSKRGTGKQAKDKKDVSFCYFFYLLIFNDKLNEVLMDVLINSLPIFPVVLLKSLFSQ